MTRAYYNEIDPPAAAVLRELIARDVIAPGDVDTRSIKEVTHDDLRGYTQCHFFAGGGLWSVAARLAGWPDARPLWTGSCPCQPWSAAGKGGGADDPRHLWPDFHRLISAARPAVVMGEQTSGAAGYGWFDGVGASMASENYAGRAVDIPVCAIDGPHQRNRLYWIFNLQPDAQEQRGGTGLREDRSQQHWPLAPDGHGNLQSDADRGGRAGRQEVSQRSEVERAAAERAPAGLLADADQPELQGQPPAGQQPLAQPHARPLRNGSWWADGEWIVSPLDEKARRAKPGLPFLVDGLPGRVDLWRVGGNAISPILAAEVIAAFLDTELSAEPMAALSPQNRQDGPQ
jgi:DNA (cytosine-5)-methyltransferase 1